jgi:acylglycerol lipase
LGEHSGRYKNLFDVLTPASISYFALDHLGHGRSEGKRGVIASFDDYLLPLKKLVEMARETVGKKQIFLFGHSLGGLIAISYALRFPETIDALISSGALLKVAVEVPPIKAALGKILSGLLPSLAMGNELDPALISHDLNEVQAYVNDPLVHDRISTRLYTEMTGAMDTALSRAGSLNLPLFIFHGSADRFTNPEGSKLFFEGASSKDKTLKLYEGFYHESINELEKEKVLSDIMRWIQTRI